MYIIYICVYTLDGLCLRLYNPQTLNPQFLFISIYFIIINSYIRQGVYLSGVFQANLKASMVLWPSLVLATDYMLVFETSLVLMTDYMLVL